MGRRVRTWVEAPESTVSGTEGPRLFVLRKSQSPVWFEQDEGGEGDKRWGEGVGQGAGHTSYYQESGFYLQSTRNWLAGVYLPASSLEHGQC